MKGFKVKVIKDVKLHLDNLYFQYLPDKFFKDVYPGDEKTMMSVINSPHYKFLEIYREIGNKIWDCYKDTDYIRLMKFWGRNDKYNRSKVRNLIKIYNSIKSKGLKSRIVVSIRPMYKKFFDEGYEIYHGHHRAAVCCILGHNKVKCRIVKAVKIKQ